MQQLPDTLSLAMTQYIFRLANGLGVSETAEKNTYAMPGIAAGGGTGTMINPFEVRMIRFHYYKFEFPYNDNIGSSVALFPWQTETITVGNFWQVIQQRLNEDQPFPPTSVTKYNFGFINANTGVLVTAEDEDHTKLLDIINIGRSMGSLEDKFVVSLIEF